MDKLFRGDNDYGSLEESNGHKTLIHVGLADG